MKYHIEKNTVQETLVIPLYGRKMCSELYPNLYRDETALCLIDQIDYDFSLLSQKSKSLMQPFSIPAKCPFKMVSGVFSSWDAAEKKSTRCLSNACSFSISVLSC